MNRRLTDEQIAEIFAEGMEAAHCGLFMKDALKARSGRRYEAWRAGYQQALRDGGDFPDSQDDVAS